MDGEGESHLTSASPGLPPTTASMFDPRHEKAWTTTTFFTDVYHFPFSVVIPVTGGDSEWGDWFLGWTYCVSALTLLPPPSWPLTVMRHQAQKQTQQADTLLGGVGACLVLFALFPSQTFLDLPSLSSDGIQGVVHVGAFDVESTQKSVDGGCDNGWTCSPAIRFNSCPSKHLAQVCAGAE